ncbi:restriction endonuclease subunit S [archaeon]|nr:restriction endonuclease subunit S [Nanoarchaeota archaeon]MBU4300244.1 restriction endonuclease subunit S [Nanoarchaeota archaeon]MBU4451630.1 restriction endonuclease subunit S [Nanoarchaeota archaeon]MCG2723152.1 restriction endonuclease subunit S [archaeon]
MKQQIKFKETEIGTIPEDWEVKVLSKIVNIIGGGTPKTSKPEYWGGDIPWISVADFVGSRRWIRDTEKHITKKGLEESSTNILREGQLIISARGTVGEIGQITRDMAFNQSCYGIDGKDGVINDFLYYLLRFKVRDVQSKTHGSVFSTITRQTFDQILVAIPDISEQHSIAAILSSLDNKIALNRSMNSTLESIGHALFKHWFVDFEFPNEEGKPYRSSGGEMMETDIGEVPKGWRVGKISDFGRIVCGKTPSKSNKEYFEGIIPFIKIPDMHNDVFVIKTEDSLTEKGKKFQENKTIPANSVCVSCIATVGLVCITDKDSQTNQQINSIVPEKSVYTYYLYYNISSMREFLKILGSGGSATLNINTGNFSNIDILIPSNEVLQKFHSTLNSSFMQIKNNLYQNENMSKIRDALLPKLMSGEIRVPANT